MLAAIQSDHLTGYGTRLEEEAQARLHLLERRPSLERHAGHLPLEVFLRLVVGWHGNAGADAIDPDARRQRQGQLTGEAPKARFGQGIADQALHEVPLPLTSYVDAT